MQAFDWRCRIAFSLRAKHLEALGRDLLLYIWKLWILLSMNKLSATGQIKNIGWIFTSAVRLNQRKELTLLRMEYGFKDKFQPHSHQIFAPFT
jgi:hypothetical protein